MFYRKNFKYDEVIREKINEEARDSQPRQTVVLVQDIEGIINIT